MDVVRLNGFVALLALVAACSDGNIPPPAAVLDRAERAASRAAVDPAVSRVPVASAVPVG
jgi:hypothetical protein